MKHVLNILVENYLGEKEVLTTSVISGDPNFLVLMEEKLKLMSTGSISTDPKHLSLLCVAYIDEMDDICCPDDLVEILSDPWLDDIMCECYGVELGSYDGQEDYRPHKIISYGFEAITEEDKYEVATQYTLGENEEDGVLVEFVKK